MSDEADRLPAFIKAEKIAEDFGVSLSTAYEWIARKPQDVRDRVTERSCLLFYGGEAATWAEADEKALAMEAGVATQRKLVA